LLNKTVLNSLAVVRSVLASSLVALLTRDDRLHFVSTTNHFS